MNGPTDTAAELAATCEWCQAAPATVVIGEAADIAVDFEDLDLEVVGFICGECLRKDQEA